MRRGERANGEFTMRIKQLPALTDDSIPASHGGSGKGRGPAMSRQSIHASIAAMLTLLASVSVAHATVNCLGGNNKPYKLAGDTMEWSMTISPGGDCIQGLRWSTMQIYSVSVAEKPTSGKLVLVGPGFRYFAKPDFAGADRFTLVVVGKNRRDEGTSTIQITVSRPNEPLLVSAVNHDE